MDRKILVFNPKGGDFIERVFRSYFTEAYAARFELVQQQLGQIMVEFAGLPADSTICAELACALTERCGFPVLVAFSPREPTSVVAYPVPGVP